MVDAILVILGVLLLLPALAHTTLRRPTVRSEPGRGRTPPHT